MTKPNLVLSMPYTSERGHPLWCGSCRVLQWGDGDLEIAGSHKDMIPDRFNRDLWHQFPNYTKHIYDYLVPRVKPLRQMYRLMKQSEEIGIHHPSLLTSMSGDLHSVERHASYIRVPDRWAIENDLLAVLPPDKYTVVKVLTVAAEFPGLECELGCQVLKCNGEYSMLTKAVLCAKRIVPHNSWKPEDPELRAYWELRTTF